MKNTPFTINIMIIILDTGIGEIIGEEGYMLNAFVTAMIGTKS